MDSQMEPGEIDLLSQPMFPDGTEAFTQVTVEQPKGKLASKRGEKEKVKPKVVLQVPARKTRSNATTKKGSIRKDFVDDECVEIKQPGRKRKATSKDEGKNVAGIRKGASSKDVVKRSKRGSTSREDTTNDEEDSSAAHVKFDSEDSSDDDSRGRKRSGRQRNEDDGDDVDEEEDEEDDVEDEDTEGDDFDYDEDEEEDVEPPAGQFRHRIQVPAKRSKDEGVRAGKASARSPLNSKDGVRGAFDKKGKAFKLLDFSKCKSTGGQEREFYAKIGDDWYLQYSRFQGKWYVGLRKKYNDDLNDWGFGAAFSVEVLAYLKKAIPALQAHIRKLE